ncbi:MAG: DUF2065 domain-containing protein [Steroidobacteraceae bacterium]|jgi:uncharacterized protein YjeT (DUF2065 family)|nr:DUF2065 domain-containing protein [Steroidobacteraceae bacterium]
MDWNDLWAAFALYLVLEGVMPFANPGGMKRALGQLSQLDDRTLRVAGFLSMMAGAVLLYFVRGAA